MTNIMNLSDKLIKPIIETKYLTVDNVHRYRAIVRYFYLEYEKMRYWLYPEEIYEEMVSHELFCAYTWDQCRQDLDALVEWRNLLPLQDTRKVTTIEDFKNKKFRYQLSEYTVEIERMATKLETLFSEGASLEPTLLERLTKELSRFTEISGLEAGAVYGWWNGIINDFSRLNQNYQDYIRDLNGIRAEEMMKSKAFLLFKDRLVEYLRIFIKTLQRNAGIIEKHLKHVTADVLEIIFQKIVVYDLAIPRIDVEVNEADIRERVMGRWQSLEEWFVEKPGHLNEAGRLLDRTNEIIRKITRYAAQISEIHNSGANRKEEYLKISHIFTQCNDINEAHKLSAVIFGIEKPMHIKGDFIRKTERINSGVYEEEPFIVSISPRIRNYREKINRSAIKEHQWEKEKVREQMFLSLQQEKELLESYILDNTIDFESLPVIEPEVRSTFLRWLSKALENGRRKGKTEDGRAYRVDGGESGALCVLNCTDGQFTMPKYRIVFEGERL